VRFKLNGKRQAVDVEPNETLLHLLHAKGFESVRHGCETGECGSCAVLVDGRPVNSCLMLAAQVQDRHVETVENVEHSRILQPVRQALVDCGASQCGFCMPGMLISMKALLEKRPHPDGQDIVDALSGNLCRCTHYVRPVEAIVRAVTGKSLER
jgi:aerobic-type carbon monoxide dehydrogenase small subunit (CoxS/CutS family)